MIGFIITADEEEREKKEEGKVSVEEFCRVVGEFGGAGVFPLWGRIHYGRRGRIINSRWLNDEFAINN